MSEDLVLKILLLGESGVGKSSILRRYTKNDFNAHTISSIGYDVRSKKIKYKSKIIKLNLSDTSGQERFRSIVPSFYKGTDGIIVVYDITKKDTLQKIDFWIEQLNEKAPKDYTLVLFGNKNDKSGREVSYEQAKQVADKIKAKCFEGSAKEGKGVEEAINELVKTIIDKKSYLTDESLNQSIKLGKSVFEKSPSSTKRGSKKGSDEFNNEKEKDIFCC